MYLESINMHGWYYYRLWVDGEIYTDFKAQPRLTWSQENDVIDLYREALTYWSLPDSV